MWSIEIYIATRILINRRLTSPRDHSRFRTKVACIKNNVLLFFLFFYFLFTVFWFARCFVFLIAPIRATNARSTFPSSPLLLISLSPSLPEMFWLHERGARINFSLLHFLVSFRSFLFFLTHSPVKFPRQTDNTDGSLRKSLVRAKAKSDDLSLSPKATSKNFLFTFYTYKESLSLSYTHARTHSRTHTRIFSLSFSPEPVCRRSRQIDQIGQKNRSVIGFSIYVKRLYSCVKSNPKD